MADVGCDVLYINHAIDNRVTEAQDSVVSTHNSQYKTLSKKINAIKVSKLLQVNVKDYQYIAIDEGQFFEDLYEAVVLWTTTYGKTVYVASLDGDAYRRKFGRVLDLIPSADKVEKLTAFCDMCRINRKELREAPFTARLVKNTDVTLVGGVNIYKAMCRECHDRHLSKNGN
jgi:thymidine kinase